MNQQQFGNLQQADKIAKKSKIARLMAEIREVQSCFKSETIKRKQELEIHPRPVEKLKNEESYSIHRHLSHKLREMDRLRAWDVHNAEVKFVNKEDLLLFQIAIPRKAESSETNKTNNHGQTIEQND